MRLRRIVGASVVGAAMLVGSVVTSGVASAQIGFDVLLSGLSSPKGVALSLSGNPIIGQGAFGPPGPVLLYKLLGRNAGSTVELTDPLNVVDVAMASDGSLWWIGGDLVLYRQDPGGAVHTVLDIPAYQATDPDPFDVEDNPTESNPYGLAVLPSGDALVADAASNDLLRVTPGGATTTVARLDVEAVSTDHLPPGPWPPTIDAESVPTSVTLGPDGWAYVAELKGFPFRPGSSNVWRIDPNAEGAICSVDTADPHCSVYATGLTAIQDIAFHNRTSVLFVYELAADGVLPFEEGFETGVFPPAVLLKMKNNRSIEIAAGLLSEPGGIAVRGDGTVLVTDGVFSTGRLVGLGV
jgi:hypothetical protein